MPRLQTQDGDGRPRPRRSHAGPLGLAVVLTTVLAVKADEPPSRPSAEPVAIRDGFETPRTVWNQEQTDATIHLLAHDRTDRAAHEGRTSEHFRFTAGLGSGFFFSYPLPKVPVTDALKVTLYVRASRAGSQLFARVVLPADTDPETNQPSFLLVPGTIYDDVDRWERLEVYDLRLSLERQARVLRASTKRAVSLEGAYVEQLVVNLFSGAGEAAADVYLDELAVGPVPAALASGANDGAGQEAEAAAPAGAGASAPAADAGAPAAARVVMPRNRLKKRADDGGYHDWFFTGIHAPGADVASLRNAGFDVLIDDIDADPKRLRQAVDKGFMLMPRVRPGRDDDLDADRVVRSLAAFPYRDAVVAWHLGGSLGKHADPGRRKAELDFVRESVRKMRGLPPGVSRLSTGVVADDLSLYARKPQNLDMLGIRPPGWGTAVSPMDNYLFLRQRRNLTVMANADALFWAFLPATPPPVVQENVWGLDVPPAWGTPMVQAEQVRWMTYAALSAGYRGLAFEGDADLTRGPGRALLLEMALLNAEVDLCESILANGVDPIPTYMAYDPDPPLITPNLAMNMRPPKKPEAGPVLAVRGAAIGTRDKKGVLLIAADYAGAAQFQPMQSARNDLTMTVVAPENAEAFEISPGRVRVLEHKREVGGMRITIPEFDTTALVLVTADMAMAERVEAVVNGIRPRAVQMAIEQAELKLQWASDVNARLAVDGHYLIDAKERKRRRDTAGPLPTDEADLLGKAGEAIKAARDYAERLDWENAWSEARRASRPLRILMRGHWNNAQAELDRANTPAEDLANEDNIRLGRVRRVGAPTSVPATGCAPLISFNTLPQHYLWLDWMKSGRFGRNLIPSGSFDDAEALKDAGWANVGYQYDGVRSVAEVIRYAETPPKEKNARADVPAPEVNVRHLLKLTVLPARALGIDSLPPFLDFAAGAVRSPGVPVRAGQFLRVSVSVKRTVPTVEGVGGVIVRDSIGGESMQYVSGEPSAKFVRVVLYRRAPEDGEMTVTLGLAGYGTVLFDDLKVERVEAAPDLEPPGVVNAPRPPRASAPPPTARRTPAADRPSR